MAGVFLTLSGGCEEPVGADRSEVGDPEPTLESVVEHVFEPACALSGCHAGAEPAGELDLSSVESARAGLVEVDVINAVAAENRWLRVKPGEPELSFLVRKLTGPGLGEGAPMPPGANQVSGYYVDLVAQWIEEGAP